ncbi:MAG: FecR domain-containing protein [Myxococcota bacterium]
MKQCQNFENYLAKLLSDKEKEAFEAHLKHCQSCRIKLEQENNLSNQLQELWQQSPSPEVNQRKTEQLLAKAFSNKSNHLGKIVWVAGIFVLILGVVLGLSFFNTTTTTSEHDSKPFSPTLKLIRNINAKLVGPNAEGKGHISANANGKLLFILESDKIGLDSKSSMDFSVKKEFTSLKLTKGQVAIHKNKNSDRSFEVIAGEITIKVTGTIFFVSLQQNNIITTGVVHGKIIVESPGNKRINCRAGQQITIKQENIIRENLTIENKNLVSRLLADSVLSSSAPKASTLTKSDTSSPKNKPSTKTDKASDCKEKQKNEIVPATTRKNNKKNQADINNPTRNKTDSPQTKQDKTNNESDNPASIKNKTTDKSDNKNQTGQNNQVPEKLDSISVKKLIIKKKFSKVENILRKWLQKNNTDAKAWWLLGESLRKKGANKKALAAYGKCKTYAGKRLANRARYRQALLYHYKLGNPVKAAVVYKKYLKQPSTAKPLSDSASWHLAKALAANGKKSEAKIVLRKLIKNNSGTYKIKAENLLKSLKLRD